MSEPGKVTRLYLARWPDGTVTILSAECFEHAVDRIDRIDQIGDASARGRSARRRVADHAGVGRSEAGSAPALDPASEIDSQREIMSLAFPVLSRLVEATDPSATGTSIRSCGVSGGRSRRTGSSRRHRASRKRSRTRGATSFRPSRSERDRETAVPRASRQLRRTTDHRELHHRRETDLRRVSDDFDLS